MGEYPSRLEGVICATVTPISSTGKIDTEGLAAYCTDLLNRGCAFTSIFGTTGEGPSFSVDEKIEALRDMASTGLDMSRQIPAIMETSLHSSARLYRAIADLGCRAALIVPPFYYAPAPEGIADFYAAIIKDAGAPETDIVLYNIPQLSGVTFSAEVVRAVMGVTDDRVVGIKDSTGDLDSGLALIANFPELAVFTGDDRLLAPLRAKGGAGLIGGMPNLFLDTCLQIFRDEADDDLITLASKRIEAVEGHGGLVVLKEMVARMRQDAAFQRVAPPLQPLAGPLDPVVEMALGA